MASLHRLPTLCRPFHGLKLCLCPWWRGGEDTLKIFFSCDLLLIFLHRLVAGVAVARETGDIATRRWWSEPAASGTPVTAPPPPGQAPERERHSYGAGGGAAESVTPAWRHPRIRQGPHGVGSDGHKGRTLLFAVLPAVSGVAGAVVARETGDIE